MSLSIRVCVCVCACSVLKLRPTLCDHMDGRPPGSCVHGDSPGKSTGVGCHFLLLESFLTQGSNLLSPELAGGFFTADPPGKPHDVTRRCQMFARGKSRLQLRIKVLVGRWQTASRHKCIFRLSECVSEVRGNTTKWFLWKGLMKQTTTKAATLDRYLGLKMALEVYVSMCEHGACMDE